MTNFIITLLFTFYSLTLCSSDFGYIGYSTENLGDDIQAIAAKRFLPENSIPIERDFIGTFENSSQIPVIVNGWFMLRNNFYSTKEKHNFNWPPSINIDPLLISLHFTPNFIKTLLSKRNKQYLIDHGPVGARDYYTLQILQKYNIPSYFSGCITLTLQNDELERDDIVYAVDIDKDCLTYLKKKTSYPVEELTHTLPENLRLDTEGRLKLTETLLTKYKKAKFVVTSRLHVALPCLAFQTPVLLIDKTPDDSRFFGLKELTRHCDSKTFLKGKSNFDLNNPNENSDLYLPIRENLIKAVNDWIQEKSTS